MSWVSWRKGGSKSTPGLGTNEAREIGLESRFVDVKICSIDETWSGLKFVKRLKERRPLPNPLTR